VREIGEREKRRGPEGRTPVLACSDWAMPRTPGITAACAGAQDRAASVGIAVAPRGGELFA